MPKEHAMKACKDEEKNTFDILTVINVVTPSGQIA
jgi:hypothetical protein